MVWVWIIIAIIIIALIIWFLMRARSARSAAGQPSVGRHASGEDRSGPPPGMASTPPTRPDLDTEPRDSSAGSAMSAEAAPAGGADTNEFTRGTEHTTTNYGSAADPTPDSASAMPAGEPVEAGAADADGPSTAVPVVGQDRHGQDDVSALPADGSDEFDDVHDAVDTAHSPTAAPQDVTDAQPPLPTATDPQRVTAAVDGAPRRGGTDEEVAALNDDPAPRVGDAPTQSAAATARHDDLEFRGTEVQHPSEGSIAPDAAASGEARESVAEPAATPAEPVDAPVERDPMTERFGEGATSPRSDGAAPDGFTIKGNADSMLFHTPDSPRYDATTAAVWFTDEIAATSAGFAHWDREKRGQAPEEPAGGTSYTTGTSDTGVAVTGLTGTSQPATEPEVPAAEPVEPTDPDPMREQFGEGAASPRADGSAPSERHTIKGNADTMLFHTSDSPHYDRTEAEVWFADEESAKAAGFQHWDHRKR